MLCVMKSNTDWLIENLPYIRAFAGWSQEQLAMGLDCSTSFINKLERGKLEMSVMCYLALERLIFAECETNPWLDDAVAILNGHIRYGITREDLIEKVSETRKRLWMKSGSEKLMRELRMWLQSAEEEQSKMLVTDTVPEGFEKFELSNGKTYYGRANGCFFCSHLTDIFLDHNGPYALRCDCKDDTSKGLSGECPFFKKNRPICIHNKTK